MFEKFKKKKDGMSDNEKQAKMDAISGLRDVASNAMKHKLDGLKKVTVASDSPKGLEKGLDIAKKLAGHMPNKEEASEGEGDMSPEELSSHEASESPSEESSENVEEGSEHPENASFEDGQGESKEALMAELEQKMKEFEELKAKIERA